MASTVYFNGDYSAGDLHIPTTGKTEWGVDTLQRHIGMGVSNLKAYLNGLLQGAIYLYAGPGNGTTQTSGTLIPGNKYTVTTFVSGDNFSNVGGTNTTGTNFIATGTTPTTWSHGSTLTLNATAYYLQTWEDDHNPVYPTVTLNYKGLATGIPDPWVTGETVDANMSRSTSMEVSITYYDFTLQANVTKNVNATINIQYKTRRSTWKYIYFATAVQSGTTLSYVPPNAAKYSALDVAYTPQIIVSTITADGGLVFASNAPIALATALAPALFGLVTFSAPQPIWGSPFFECIDQISQLLV